MIFYHKTGFFYIFHHESWLLQKRIILLRAQISRNTENSLFYSLSLSLTQSGGTPNGSKV